MERLPHTAAGGGEGGSGLPARIALRAVIVQRLTLAPALAGTAVALHIEAAGERTAPDQAQAHLLATAIGGPARYHLVLSLAPTGLQARLTAREPADGPLARLAGLAASVPGLAGSLDLVATAAGPLKALATEAKPDPRPRPGQARRLRRPGRPPPAPHRLRRRPVHGPGPGRHLERRAPAR